MTYALYIGYHVLLLFAAVLALYRSRLGLLAFVAALVPIAFLNDLLVPAADLNWYRNVFDDLSMDTIAIFALANDFEVGWAAAVVAVKAALGDTATLGLSTAFLLALPLLWRRVRENIEFLALLLVFPGSFLILFNTMRQGFSEYFLLAGLLSGSWPLMLLSGTIHRFGFVVVALSRIMRRIPPQWLLVPGAIVSLFFWRLLKVISPDNDMQAIYGQLSVNYVSLALKLLTCSLPNIAARLARRAANQPMPDTEGWRYANAAFLALAGGTLVSILIHPRLADRIAFYVLPVAIWSLSQAGVSRAARAGILALAMTLGLASLALGSHQEFFDIHKVVTDELEHGEEAE